MELYVLILRVLILVFGANICLAGQSCPDGTFLSDTQCRPCPSRCSTCVDANNCTSCEPKFWGIGSHVCKKACPTTCYGEKCHEDTGFCQWGCVKGYRWSSQGRRECMKRPDGCEVCINELCVVCAQGYHHIGKLCRRYRQDCKTCKMHKCIECVDGRFGDECEHECTIENCKTCSLNETLEQTCVECNPHLFLQNGKCVCSPNCVSKCNIHGRCFGACVDGFSGDYCETACPKNCKACSKYRKDRCWRCEDGFYGSRCDMKCGVGCLTDKNKEDTTCSINDGTCNHGCIDGRQGKRCNLSCSRQCIRRVCDQFNGRCVYGCIEGFEGAKCLTKKVDKEVSDSLTPSTESTTDYPEYEITDFYTDMYYWNQTEFSTVAARSEFDETTVVYYYDENSGQEKVKQTETSTNVVYIGSGISVFVLMMIILVITIYLVKRRNMSASANQNAAPNTVSSDNLASSQCHIGVNPRDQQNGGPRSCDQQNGRPKSRDQQNGGGGDGHYDYIDTRYVARKETVNSVCDNNGYLTPVSIHGSRNPDQMYLTPVFSGEHAACDESSSYEKLNSESMKRNTYLDLKTVNEYDAAL